jgi:2-dehydro-3-deoxyphosphogalactonate aldolase
MTPADAFAKRPLIAILRGVVAQEAFGVGEALIDAGFTMIEAPLNGPEALASIRILSASFGARAAIGAGTVLRVEDVGAVRDAGASYVVSPNTNRLVIEAAKASGLWTLPGVGTASECFAALDAGADGLKLFPAEMMPPAAVKALRALLPRDVPLVAVGGIDGANLAAYRAAGATGFGFGGALYAPGRSALDVGACARALVAAWEACG